MNRGIFVVIDGLDGVGKGVFLDELEKCAIQDGYKIFDVDEFSKKNNRLPTILEVEGYSVLKTSEPTYQGIGKVIRDELISTKSPHNMNGLSYHTSDVAQAYSVDRAILLRQLLIPALSKGIHIFQSRSVSTTLVYQGVTGKDHAFSHENIIALEGNKFALKNSPHYLIIPTVDDVEIVISRLESREKKDDAIFEKIEFQKKLKSEYESKWLKDLFESHGTKVIYMDAGRNIEHSRTQIRDFYNITFCK